MQISVSAKKIALDFVMILVIASIYSKNVVSLMYHEVMGLSLTALFLVHLIFNRSFITKVTPRVFSGRTPLRTVILWVLNLLLLISWTAVAVTGVLISKKLFSFGVNALIPWHFFFAAAGLALTGMHIGFHWDYLAGWIHRLLPVTVRFKKFMKLLLAAAVLYGCFTLFTGSVGTWASAPFRSRSQEQRYNAEGTASSGGESRGSGEGRSHGAAAADAADSRDHAAAPDAEAADDTSWSRQDSSARQEAASGGSRTHAAQPFSPAKLLQLALNMSCVLMFFAFTAKNADRLLLRSAGKRKNGEG